MGGALWRVDVAIDAPVRVSADAGLKPASSRRSYALRGDDREWFDRPLRSVDPAHRGAAGERILLAPYDPEDDTPREVTRFAVHECADRPSRSSDNGLRYVRICARCRALWAPAGCALRWPWRRTEGVPCGTDVMKPTYACAISSSTSFEQSTRWQPSRSCLPVPRGGVVNARRPGRRPGRSEAKSIDDAEHGASMISAMVRCLNPDLQT